MVTDTNLFRPGATALRRDIHANRVWTTMLDDRTGPFADGRPAWAPDPSWPGPTLPADAADPATAQ